jgi:tetratricopeptide (TPR) repeat protein
MALKHMVEMYESLGETKQAIENLSKLTVKSPNNVDRRLRLSELLIEDNRPDEAKAVLDLLEMEKRIVSEIRAKVADLLEKAGFMDAANTTRMQMVDDELDNFAFCNNVAVGLRKQGGYEDADEIYRKILNTHPDEAVLWFNRAVNLAAWGRRDKSNAMLREAIDHFRRSLKLSPDYWEADRAIQQLKLDIRKDCKGERLRIA